MKNSLDEQEFHRSLYIGVFLIFLVPPFVGGTLLGIAGFYPMPEFFGVFFNVTGIYFAGVLSVVYFILKRYSRQFVQLLLTDIPSSQSRTKKILKRLPWYLIGITTTYSIFGAITADISLENMGYANYTMKDHLNHQLGVIPVVLITCLPIFFYLTDKLGLFLGAYGEDIKVITLDVKVIILGIFTPLMIDTFLVGYFFNHTGFFKIDTLVVWFVLLSFSILGTLLAIRSIYQGLKPLENFVKKDDVSDSGMNQLLPMSLDEFGILTKKVRKLTEQIAKERDFARKIVQNVPAMIVRLDNDASIIFVNTWFEKVTGYSLDELKGENWFDIFIDEKDRKRIEEVFEKAVDGDRTQGNINTIKTKDGREIEVEWFDEIITDEIGRFDSLLVTGTDITERLHNERRLSEERERYETLLNILPCGVQENDKNGIITFSNHAHSKMFGLPPGAMVGKYIWEVCNDSEKESFKKYLSQLVECQPEPTVFEAKNVHSDGHLFDVNVKWDYRYDSKNNLIGFISVITDVTEDKRFEKEILESKMRLDLAQSIAKIGSWELNHVNGALYWTDQIYKLFGLDKEYFKPSYESFLSAVHPDDRESVNNAFKQSLSTQKSYQIRHRIVDKTGKKRWVEERCDTSFDNDGNPIISRGTVQDITDLQNVEERLSKVASIVKYSSDFIGFADIEGNAQFINKAGRKMVGIDENDELDKLKVIDFFASKDKPFVARTIIPEVMKFGRWVGEFNFKNFKTGEMVPVWFDMFRIDDNQGVPKNFATITRDTSELKEVRESLERHTNHLEELVYQRTEELQNAIVKAEEASRAKTDFLSRMSHELRTPLNAIIGFSQLLQADGESELSDDQKDNLSEILSASEHLLHLVNEVLDLSRIESGRVDLNIEPVPLKSIFERCVSQLEPLAKQRNILLEINESADCWVSVDAFRLKQILINLISNAIKYNKNSGSVLIYCENKDSHTVRVLVKDTGRGISEDKLVEIFSPFERSVLPNENIEGTGIGLALAKRLVTAMNGEIGVSSTIGEGSVFWLDIPLAQSNQ
ncbi:PAS domain S-box protein [Pleionea sediminis]|uniref:PAS domain S-box protein n=1 Tax=Pleionea sediminis TaxID=2569479 RepID=UPI0011866826|nr:PAS domain S-box protein [Pleionea sediminis]